MKINIKKRACKALEEQPVKKRTIRVGGKFQKTQKKEEVRKEISKDPAKNAVGSVLNTFQKALPKPLKIKDFVSVEKTDEPHKKKAEVKMSGGLLSEILQNITKKTSQSKNLDLALMKKFSEEDFPELDALFEILSSEKVFDDKNKIQDYLDTLDPLIELSDMLKNLYDYLKIVGNSHFFKKEYEMKELIKTSYQAISENKRIQSFLKQYPKWQLHLTRKALQNKKQEPQSQTDKDLEKKASQYSFDVDPEHLKGNLKRVTDWRGVTVAYKDEKGKIYPKHSQDSDDETGRVTAISELKALSEDFEDYSEEVRIAKSVAQEINLSFEEEIFNLQVDGKQSPDFDHTITNDVLDDYITANDDFNELIHQNELDFEQQKGLFEDIRTFFYLSIHDEPTLISNSILFRVMGAQLAFNKKIDKDTTVSDEDFDRFSEYVFPDMEEALMLASEKDLMEAKMETEDSELGKIEEQLNYLSIIKKKEMTHFSLDKKYDDELKLLQTLFPQTIKELEKLETRIDVEKEEKRDIKATFEKYFPPLAKIQKSILSKRDAIEKEFNDLGISLDQLINSGTVDQETMDIASEFQYYEEIIFFLERMYDFFGDYVSRYIGLKNLRGEEINQYLFENSENLKLGDYNFLPFYDEKTKRIVIKKAPPQMRFKSHFRDELSKLYKETQDPDIKYLLLNHKKNMTDKERKEKETHTHEQTAIFLKNAAKDMNNLFKKERIKKNNEIRNKLEAKMREVDEDDKEKQVHLYQLHQYADVLLLEFPHRFESDLDKLFFIRNKDLEVEVDEIFKDKKTSFEREDLFENNMKIKIKLKKQTNEASKCTGPTKKASSTSKDKKWMKCVKDGDSYKRIHWGQKGVRVTGKSGNTKRKKSFKARHGCSSAKANTPKGQACKDWA